MANLYITSAETYSGKSALCIGLGLRFKADGLKVGYMKPVNTFCELCEGLPSDDDVVFARNTFELTDPIDLMAPVGLTPARMDSRLRGPDTNFEPKIKDAFAKLSQGRDVMVIEGARNLAEGYVLGLPPVKVAQLLDARVLMVLRYSNNFLMDYALGVKEHYAPNLIGAVINEVPRSEMDRVHDIVVPFLMRHDLQVLGALPREQILAAPSVAELATALNAEILCCADRMDDLVEHLLVGAMSAEAALSYFRKKPNKAVVTGGDRGDIQLAALETSTRVLILTGNLYPSPAVLNRAEELNVPVLLANLDTLTTTEVVEHFFGRSRFQQPQKVERFEAMLNEHMNFDALYEGLELKRR